MLSLFYWLIVLCALLDHKKMEGNGQDLEPSQTQAAKKVPAPKFETSVVHPDPLIRIRIQHFK
jgi:hypothetical protein